MAEVTTARNRFLFVCCISALIVSGLPFRTSGQTPSVEFLNRKQPILDAHNCYPYDGRWADRITHALDTGFPVGIEQDLAWYVDPATGKGRAVVTHKTETNGSEPSLRDYFFERVRPIVEAALNKGDQSRWPLIVVHFDFKDNREPLLRAVWSLLGEYEPWITTAQKTANPHRLMPWDVKPLLVLTEDPDAQERIFFDDVPEGSKLRLFGSAHSHVRQTQDRQEAEHLLATTPADELLADRPTNYRRWWNNSWHEVEEGGQQKAGPWTEADDARLHALVDHAHRLGYWIRFYTLDGFKSNVGKQNGWFEGYNFGSLGTAKERWNASLKAGVDLIATDQYEDLAAEIKDKR